MSRARQVSQLIGASNTHVVTTPATFSNTVTVANSGITFGDATVQNTAASGFGFKNRIINGAMVIDQRNGGASVAYGSTTTAGNYYGYNVDRWWAQSYSTTAGNGAAFTVQQSSVAPTGIPSSIVATVTSSQTTLQSDSLYRIQQVIEGYNVADIGFGSATASAVTLSFWVRSNLTGTFTGVLGNDVDYAYPFTYTINAANVWQQIVITIPGATAGTWLKNNGKGILIAWCLGAHTSRLGTAGAWVASANYQGASGQTNFMATVGNTFYITGVQLEKGSTATSFDYRPYTTELQLCQRYYEVGDNQLYLPVVAGNAVAAINFKVTKRASASITTVYGNGSASNVAGSTNGITWVYYGTSLVQVNSWTASAEL